MNDSSLTLIVLVVVIFVAGMIYLAYTAYYSAMTNGHGTIHQQVLQTDEERVIGNAVNHKKHPMITEEEEEEEAKE